MRLGTLVGVLGAFALAATGCEGLTGLGGSDIATIQPGNGQVTLTGPGMTRVAVVIKAKDSSWVTRGVSPRLETTGPFTASWNDAGQGWYYVLIAASEPGSGAVTITLGGKSAQIDVSAEALFAKSVYFGYGDICALDLENAPWCWGGNDVGQLGVRTASTCSGACPNWAASYGNEAPLKMSGVRYYQTIATSGYSCTASYGGPTLVCGQTCGIMESGQLLCGGYSTTSISGASLKTLIMRRGLTDAMPMCGLGSDDKAYCFGGPGALVEIGGQKTYRSLGVGKGYACGIDLSGDAWCWSLGIGFDIAAHVVPERVATSLKFGSIELAENTACALDVDGKPYCWEVGAGSPSALPGARTYSAIAVGQSNRACALAGDGAVDCWEGFGTGAFPAPIPTALTSISVGGTVPATLPGASFPYFACGISVDHVVTCWNRTQSYKIGQ